MFRGCVGLDRWIGWGGGVKRLNIVAHLMACTVLLCRKYLNKNNFKFQPKFYNSLNHTTSESKIFHFVLSKLVDLDRKIKVQMYPNTRFCKSKLYFTPILQNYVLKKTVKTHKFS